MEGGNSVKSQWTFTHFQKLFHLKAIVIWCLFKWFVLDREWNHYSMNSLWQTYLIGRFRTSSQKFLGYTRPHLMIYTCATLWHSWFTGTACELESPFCVTSQKIATAANDGRKKKHHKRTKYEASTVDKSSGFREYMHYFIFIVFYCTKISIIKINGTEVFCTF